MNEKQIISMREKGYTYNDIALHFHCAISTIYNIVKKKKRKVDTFDLYAEWYKLLRKPHKSRMEKLKLDKVTNLMVKASDEMEKVIS